MRVFKAKLEKDQATWQRYQASLQDYNSVQKVSKVDYLRTQDQALAEKVGVMADVTFPVKFVGQSSNIGPFVGSSSASWSESRMIVPSSLFTVYMVNLTALGSAAARAVGECVRVVADACAHIPERTMAIFFGPNVAGHGQTYDEAELEKCHDDCEQMLKADDLGLKVRRGHLIFDPETIASRSRASVHPMWMCISDQTQADGELICKFASSQLWNRRAVHNISMKPVANYVVPFMGVASPLPNSFTKAQRHKQHISGVDLWDKLRDNLWKGMHATSSSGCVLVDLLPYDDSLLLSTVQGLTKNRPKEPQEMVISCIWARGDQEQDKRRNNAEWLSSANQRCMERLVRNKILLLEGFDYKEFKPEGAAPLCDTQLYTLTFPTAEGHLAMRQTALDEWSLKFARLKKDFDEAVDKHNKEFNPSGFPYKADGQKRAAPGNSGEDDGEEGIPFPDGCTFDSLESLTKAEGKVNSCKSFLPHIQLVFSSKGGMYLHALDDGVISSKRPLCQIYGEFHSGEAEIQKANKRKATLHTWKLTALDQLAVWGHPAEWDPPFKVGLATFREFMSFLADHNVVTFSLVCHDVTLEPGNENISPNEECAFEPKKLPPKAVAEVGNCGSLVAWSSIDWEKGESQNGMLKMYYKMMYEDSSQGKGIFPTKPVWILSDAREVVKGKCYQVIPPPGQS